jgi:hypothetical protein
MQLQTPKAKISRQLGSRSGKVADVDWNRKECATASAFPKKEKEKPCLSVLRAMKIRELTSRTDNECSTRESLIQSCLTHDTGALPVKEW